jgi:hypothetical protein
MSAYTIQLNTSFPVPRYRTFVGMYDPIPIALPRVVQKVDDACADHGEIRNFEAHLNEQSTLAVVCNKGGLMFDSAEDIQAKSVYLSPPLEKPV